MARRPNCIEKNMFNCHLLQYISYMKSMGSDLRFPPGGKKETAVRARTGYSKGAAVGTMTQSLKRT
jgi:hypothetical protein